MTLPEPASVEEQTATLAERYTVRAEAYDALWSPVIRPVGEHLLNYLPLLGANSVLDVGTGAGALLPAIRTKAPTARVVGVDRSPGMLRIAAQKHFGPLALMDAQALALANGQFDVAVVAFVLFHLPYPEQCLEEVNRVLKEGGMVGAVTWGEEQWPAADAIWDEELEGAGARVAALPALESRSRCNTPQKMKAILEQAGFVFCTAWTELLEYQWRSEVHFEDQVRRGAQLRLQCLDERARQACLWRVQERVSGLGEEQYRYRADVVIATGVKRLKKTRGDRSMPVVD